MLSSCVGVEDIESGPKATPEPERRRPDSSGWPCESVYYKGFVEGPVWDGHSCPSQLILILKQFSAISAISSASSAVKSFERRARRDTSQGTQRNALV